MRVTAQLIRADNGYHLWSQTYDRDANDIFKVQDEIAAAVVAELKTQLLPAAQAAGAREAVSPEAHNQYLLGRQYLTRSNGRDSRRAAQAFARATEIDAHYAPAWAGLADASYWVADDAESAAARDASLEQAIGAADKAIALQPSLAYGFLARGLIRSTLQWDFTGGAADFRRAAELDPDSVDVAMNYAGAVLIPTGRLEEAATSLRKAADADPLNARVWSWLGYAWWFQGDVANARAALERSLQVSPEQNYAPAVLAQTYLADGQAGKTLEYSQRSTSEVFSPLRRDARRVRARPTRRIRALTRAVDRKIRIRCRGADRRGVCLARRERPSLPLARSSLCAARPRIHLHQGRPPARQAARRCALHGAAAQDQAGRLTPIRCTLQPPDFLAGKPCLTSRATTTSR